MLVFRSPLSLTFCSALALLSGCGGHGDDAATIGDLGKADNPAEPLYDYELRLESVWKNVDGTAGKQYLAAFDEDIYSHSDHFVLYGEKNGSLRVRDFQGWIHLDPDYPFALEDHWYTMLVQPISDDELEIILEGKNGSSYEFTFERQAIDDELEAGAVAAVHKFYAKYDELRNSPVETVDDLKAHVRMHMRTHDYEPNDAYDAPDWQLETHWLQIEGGLLLGKSNDQLAGVEVAADHSDAVSQHYLATQEANGFTNDLGYPEDYLDDWDWEAHDYNEPIFYTVSEEIEGVEEGPIRDGLLKFATHTFKRNTAFECEDSYDWTPDYTWYLSDGTSLRYYVSPECD